MLKLHGDQNNTKNDDPNRFHKYPHAQGHTNTVLFIYFFIFFLDRALGPEGTSMSNQRRA